MVIHSSSSFHMKSNHNRENFISFYYISYCNMGSFINLVRRAHILHMHIYSLLVFGEVFLFAPLFRLLFLSLHISHFIFRLRIFLRFRSFFFFFASLLNGVVYNPQCHSIDPIFYSSWCSVFIQDFIWWFATKCSNNEMQLIAAFCIIFQIMELVSFFHSSFRVCVLFFIISFSLVSFECCIFCQCKMWEWRESERKRVKKTANPSKMSKQREYVVREWNCFSFCCHIIWNMKHVQCVEIFVRIKIIAGSLAIKIPVWCTKCFSWHFLRCRALSHSMSVFIVRNVCAHKIHAKRQTISKMWITSDRKMAQIEQQHRLLHSNILTGKREEEGKKHVSLIPLLAHKNSHM